MEGKLASVPWPKSATRLESVTKCIYYLQRHPGGRHAAGSAPFCLVWAQSGYTGSGSASSSCPFTQSEPWPQLGWHRSVRWKEKSDYHNCSLAFTHMLCSVQPPPINKCNKIYIKKILSKWNFHAKVIMKSKSLLQGPWHLCLVSILKDSSARSGLSITDLQRQVMPVF